MGDHLKVWENYQRFAEFRGELVTDALLQFTPLSGKKVLDIGCGEGGSAFKLAQHGAKVTALDIRPELAEKFKNSNIRYFCSSIDDFMPEGEKFDIIILQDVLEHVPDPDATIEKVSQLLYTKGLVYISTPNRWSALNAFSDPHWNLPGVSLLSRKWVNMFVKNIFRKDRRQRDDWAALLSLGKLKKLLTENGFEIYFINSWVAEYIFLKPQSVVCKPTHIKLIYRLKKLGLESWLCSLVNNRFGFFNYFINPTWYLIGRWK